MSNAPVSERITAEINYWTNLWPLWQTTPTKFGLIAAQVTNLKNAADAARNAYDAAQAARKAAKDATQAQSEALRAMRTVGREDVNIIKAFIEQSGDPTLWADAGLTPPAPRGTVPPPTAPFDITGTLDTEGNFTLRWKSSQPAGASGTVFSIYRGLNDDEPTLLDTVGPRTFTDEGIPAGTRTVAYFIKAKRSGKTSPASAMFTVRFGRTASGQLRIASTKLAA